MSPATQPESKAATLMRRLASSVVLLGVVFYGLLAGGPISLFLVGGIIMLLNIVGLFEFYGMVNANGLPRFKWLGLAGGVTLVGTLFVYLSGLAKQQLGEPTTGGAAELELGILPSCCWRCWGGGCSRIRRHRHFRWWATRCSACCTCRGCWVFC